MSEYVNKNYITSTYTRDKAEAVPHAVPRTENLNQCSLRHEGSPLTFRNEYLWRHP